MSKAANIGFCVVFILNLFVLIYAKIINLDNIFLTRKLVNTVNTRGNIIHIDQSKSSNIIHFS